MGNTQPPTDNQNAFWTIKELDTLKDSFRTRWGIEELPFKYPWWRPPAKVRILMYADEPVRFNGGPFLGLQYVKTLLESRAYYYVDFEITTAHRDGSDPSASISGAKNVTDLDIVNEYDEIWFFGFNSTPNLSPAELTVISQFMGAPKFGGVLVTGDHADLGKGIAGQIPRAGAMREYPAPAAMPPGWNTTLEDGPDPGSSFDFNDQSDDRPQQIRYTQFRMWSPVWHQKRYRPHPVLCGPDGPIDVFPDHEHEGEAIAPIPAMGDSTWPTKDGHQEHPVVIGWGEIKDPAAAKYGQEIGVVSAYDGHNVDVGRILADSTWHHWFDINLTGILPPPSPYAGFDDTPTGQAAIKKIDAYFLNCGVWLAPPSKQTDMRYAGWSSIIWTNQMVELSPKAPLWYLGEQAIDALGRRASHCTVTKWVLDWPIFKEKIPWWEWPQLMDQFHLIHLPFEQYLAGGMLRELMEQVGPWNPKLSFSNEPPDAETLARAFEVGGKYGLATLGQVLTREAELVTKLVGNDFQLPSSVGKMSRLQ